MENCNIVMCLAFKVECSLKRCMEFGLPWSLCYLHVRILVPGFWTVIIEKHHMKLGITLYVYVMIIHVPRSWSNCYLIIMTQGRLSAASSLMRIWPMSICTRVSLIFRNQDSFSFEALWVVVDGMNLWDTKQGLSMWQLLWRDSHWSANTSYLFVCHHAIWFQSRQLFESSNTAPLGFSFFLKVMHPKQWKNSTIFCNQHYSS